MGYSCSNRSNNVWPKQSRAGETGYASNCNNQHENTTDPIGYRSWKPYALYQMGRINRSHSSRLWSTSLLNILIGLKGATYVCWILLVQHQSLLPPSHTLNCETKHRTYAIRWRGEWYLTGITFSVCIFWENKHLLKIISRFLCSTQHSLLIIIT